MASEYQTFHLVEKSKWSQELDYVGDNVYLKRDRHDHVFKGPMRNLRLVVLLAASAVFLLFRKLVDTNQYTQHNIDWSELGKKATTHIISKTLSNDTTETVGFLNDMVADMWPYINVAASKMIKEIVEPLFEDLLPGPFKATKFKRIDLGVIPMKFDRIDVIDHTDTSIKLHVDVSWDGKVKIDLVSPLTGQYGVKRIQTKGRMSILIRPLVPALPIMGAMQAGFLNPPHMSIDFTGVADLADMGLVRGHIRKIINDVFASVFVVPNRLLIPVVPNLNFFDTYILPNGVLRLKLESGAGFKTGGGIFRDVPDLYVKLHLGGEKVKTSKTKDNEDNPEWNESFDFLYTDEEQNILLDVWDKDLTGDDDFGKGSISAKQLAVLNNGTADVAVMKKGKPTGASLKISAQIMEFSSNPVYFETESTINDELYGMMFIIVAGASNLPTGENLEPFCKVQVGRSQKFLTPVITKMPGLDPTMPAFNSLFRVPIDADVLEEKPSITFSLCSGSTELGNKVINFDEVLDSPNMTTGNSLDLNGPLLNASILLKSINRN